MIKFNEDRQVKDTKVSLKMKDCHNTKLPIKKTLYDQTSLKPEDAGPKNKFWIKHTE